MTLRRLAVHGYRGFAEVAALTFAVPNGRIGGGVTILVGPNNSGKSALIETLAFLLRPETIPEFSAANRNASTAGVLRIEYEMASGKAVLCSPEDGTVGGPVAWGASPSLARPDQIVVVPPRRRFPAFFSPGTMDRANYVRSDDPTRRGMDQHNFPSRLASLGGSARREFDSILERVLGYVPGWHIERAAEGQNRYFSYVNGTSPHSSEGLGDGLLALLFIASALCDSKPEDTIIIDEPELSLHPAYQRRLARILADYAVDRQVVYATHSPHFVDWRYVRAGAAVARVARTGRGSLVHELQRRTVDQLGALLEDRGNRPYVLGTDAREALFLDDGVVLVEGPDDVTEYPKIWRCFGRELPPECLYGWGVGGATKMGTIAQLLEDLGFVRVVGLLDADQAGVRDALIEQFPNYAFGCIPARDVRNKPERDGKPAVQGLLDELGRVRGNIVDRTGALVASVDRFLATGVVLGDAPIVSKLRTNPGSEPLGLALATGEEVGVPLDDGGSR